MGIDPDAEVAISALEKRLAELEARQGKSAYRFQARLFSVLAETNDEEAVWKRLMAALEG